MYRLTRFASARLERRRRRHNTSSSQIIEDDEEKKETEESHKNKTTTTTTKATLQRRHSENIIVRKNSSNSSSRRNRSMGNVPSSIDSCSFGKENTKTGGLTVVSSMETLHVSEGMMEGGKLTSGEEDDDDDLEPQDNSKYKRGDSSLSESRKSSDRSFRKFNRPGQLFLGKVAQAFQAAGQAVGSKVNQVENFMFPHPPQLGGAHYRPASRTVIPKVRGGVLLRGCLTDEEHKQYVRTILEKLRPLKSKEGLNAAGFEYRIVPIDLSDSEPTTETPPKNDGPVTTGEEKGAEEVSFAVTVENAGDRKTSNDNNHPEEAVGEESQGTNYESDDKNKADDENDESTTKETVAVSLQDKTSTENKASVDDDDEEEEERATMTRLFHIESNAMITGKNRKLFIADGDMYDNIARLCQEYAQEIMIQEGDMEWVTVSEAGNNAEPIRALVSGALSKDDSVLDKKPTLLIATGKGKVRAGIFSRQHIMISGLECSTALPIVRQAKKRNMNVVMLDPNVHGERLGMVTFEKSMARLFRRWESDEMEYTCPSDKPPLAKRDLFVLSHSQSGAQLARYLLEKSEHYVPHIRAVAFTDATHNIQWAKQKEDLHQLLESDKCVYFRCAKETSENTLKPLDSVGKEVETDSFWEHRFGRVNTRCAGTSEHSLTNWFVRSHIWNHFDRFMTRMSSSRQSMTSVDDDPKAK